MGLMNLKSENYISHNAFLKLQYQEQPLFLILHFSGEKPEQSLQVQLLEMRLGK